MSLPHGKYERYNYFAFIAECFVFLKTKPCMRKWVWSARGSLEHNFALAAFDKRCNCQIWHRACLPSRGHAGVWAGARGAAASPPAAMSRSEFALSTSNTSAILTSLWHKAPALKGPLSSTDLQSQISRDALQTIVICGRFGPSRSFAELLRLWRCCWWAQQRCRVRFYNVLRGLSIDDLLKYCRRDTSIVVVRFPTTIS